MRQKSKFRLRQLGLLAVLAGIAGSAGCTWESKLYSDFVSDGKIESCPELSYIDYVDESGNIQKLENGQSYTSMECLNKEPSIRITPKFSPFSAQKRGRIQKYSAQNSFWEFPKPPLAA